MWGKFMSCQSSISLWIVILKRVLIFPSCRLKSTSHEVSPEIDLHRILHRDDMHVAPMRRHLYSKRCTRPRQCCYHVGPLGLRTRPKRSNRIRRGNIFAFEKPLVAAAALRAKINAARRGERDSAATKRRKKRCVNLLVLGIFFS